jgi:hypothetical protein
MYSPFSILQSTTRQRNAFIRQKYEQRLYYRQPQQIPAAGNAPHPPAQQQQQPQVAQTAQARVSAAPSTVTSTAELFSGLRVSSGQQSSQSVVQHTPSNSNLDLFRGMGINTAAPQQEQVSATPATSDQSSVAQNIEPETKNTKFRPRNAQTRRASPWVKRPATAPQHQTQSQSNDILGTTTTSISQPSHSITTNGEGVHAPPSTPADFFGSTSTPPPTPLDATTAVAVNQQPDLLDFSASMLLYSCIDCAFFFFFAFFVFAFFFLLFVFAIAPTLTSQVPVCMY